MTIELNQTEAGLVMKLLSNELDRLNQLLIRAAANEMWKCNGEGHDEMVENRDLVDSLLSRLEKLGK